LTSPYKFYQFWLNVSDEDAKNLIRIFTLKGQDEIDELSGKHDESTHERILQKALAEDITIRVHSREELDKAIQASKILFGRSTNEELSTIDEDTLLSVFEGVPQGEITKNDLEGSLDVTDLLSTTTDGLVFPSKGEARRMIKGGGVSINKIKLQQPEQKPEFDLLQGKYLLVQKGKKNYYLVKVIG